MLLINNSLFKMGSKKVNCQTDNPACVRVCVCTANFLRTGVSLCKVRTRSGPHFFTRQFEAVRVKG